MLKTLKKTFLIYYTGNVFTPKHYQLEEPYMGTKANKLTTPFRFRDIDSQTLLTNEVGDYGFFRQDIIQKIFSNQLTKEEEIRLDGLSIDFDENKIY